jgi:hypothetical protein
MANDAEYFENRAREERAAASSATHPAVRDRHLEMAAAYELRLRSMAADEARLGFRLVTAA